MKFFVINKLFIGLTIFTLFSGNAFGQVWINEIHYDNSGTDAGEGVELAGIAGTDLSCFDIIPYNGNGGVTYTPIGNPSGIITDQNCGFGTIWIPIAGLQNGAPDGLVLVNTCTNTIIQFLSYEGTFIATNGIANGMTSTDIGVSQNGDAVGTSIQLIGTGTSYSDFNWTSGETNSYGSVNINQSFCSGSNSISFNSPPANSFSINCNTSNSATLDFTSTGVFNSGNVYTVELSDNVGDFSNPIVLGSLTSTSNTGTISITIPIGSPSGISYRIRLISSNPAVTGDENGFDISITNDCAITTGVLSDNSFSVSCDSGSNGTISYTTSEIMQLGNTYSVELSDANGDFSYSTVIGSLNSNSSSGIINFSIPASTPTGVNYLIRVIASSPNTISNPSTPFTVTLIDGPCSTIPPHLTSVIINSCNPTCTEGYNEIVFGSTGNYSIDVNETNFNFLYGATLPGTNYTDVLVNNSLGINQLNSAAACPGLFIDATGTTIPSGASWMLVNTDICEEALTWDGLCGSGPIYVIFQNDPNWNSSGNFANSTSSSSSDIRYFETIITTTSGSTFTINYTIDGSQYANSDGVYATFNENGGPATTYGDDNCNLSPVLLPISNVNLNAWNSESGNIITWHTLFEQNNSYFTLSHSTDGFNFYPIARIEGAGQSTTERTYSFTHSQPNVGVNYYKLHSTDYDGTTYNKGIVSVLVEIQSTYYDNVSSTLIFGNLGYYEVISTDGKIIGKVYGKDRMYFDQRGMYLVRNLTNGSTERLFIP